MGKVFNFYRFKSCKSVLTVINLLNTLLQQLMPNRFGTRLNDIIVKRKDRPIVYQKRPIDYFFYCGGLTDTIQFVDKPTNTQNVLKRRLKELYSHICYKLKVLFTAFLQQLAPKDFGVKLLDRVIYPQKYHVFKKKHKHFFYLAGFKIKTRWVVPRRNDKGFLVDFVATHPSINARTGVFFRRVYKQRLKRKCLHILKFFD